MTPHRPLRYALVFALTVGLAALGSGCGGSGGGSGGGGTGLVLVSFVQAGVDNVQLNSRLELQFSGPVDPSSVTPASIQVRRGDGFGETVSGTFQVQGSKVFFVPKLPGLCDLSDSGLESGLDYLVQVVGYPDQFAVRSTSGLSLNRTTTWGFHTRAFSDPEKFEDQIPGQGPVIVESTPVTGTAAVSVGAPANNQVEILMSENLDPCTVNAGTVLIDVYQSGDSTPGTDSVVAANGNHSGFYQGGVPNVGNPALAEDGTPGDPYTWWDGAKPVGVDDTPVTGNMPQKLPATVSLVQTVTETKIIVTPIFRTDPSDPTTAIFPDNSLIVVQLTFGIEDFGGQPLQPQSISFTTEKKLTPVNSQVTLKNQVNKDTGETINPHYLENGTTARVDPDLEVVQGYLLFAGDGDNGNNQLQPSMPQSNYPTCTLDYQANDGAKDDFDPLADVVLDTGPINKCANATDGSTAVVWEFGAFRIRAGITARLIGENPAIILAQQGVTIESGGRLLVRGDGLGGTPKSIGGNGENTNSSTQPKAGVGGVGVAGGGAGADSNTLGNNSQHDGFPGYGSDDYDPFATPVSTEGGLGAGRGNAASNKSAFTGGGTSASGGGGGHSVAGMDGTAITSPSQTFVGTIDGAGGEVYPTSGGANRMLTPSAGSGGGAAGYADMTATSFVGYNSTGGAGGAGGGFVDLTSQGNVNVFGTIDAAGGRGGSGAANFYNGSGGGGGGSGGGIRILTPLNIDVSGSLITTAGGNGGAGVGATGNLPGNINNGGDGGAGRIVLEDGDSVITGLGFATTVPIDGDDGFYRGIFDASRFQGGGLEPGALTEIIGFGPLNPTYQQPVGADFLAGIPATGLGPAVNIVIEARAYRMKADGRPDIALPTPYSTIGFFTDSGNPTAPTWNDGAPNPADWQPSDGDNPLLYEGMDDTTGLHKAASDTFGPGIPIPFIQFRITFVLPDTVGPFDPGPYIDDWTVRFTHGN